MTTSRREFLVAAAAFSVIVNAAGKSIVEKSSNNTPRAKSRPVAFRVVFQVPPDESGRAFVARVREAIESAGFILRGSFSARRGWVLRWPPARNIGRLFCPTRRNGKRRTVQSGFDEAHPSLSSNDVSPDLDTRILTSRQVIRWQRKQEFREALIAGNQVGGPCWPELFDSRVSSERSVIHANRRT
jgi:hypothetical protein